MEVVAAVPCNCVGGGSGLSWMWILVIFAVLLVGSVVAALRFRRRSGSQADPVSDDAQPTTRIGLVTVTPPEAPQTHGGRPRYPDAIVAGHDDA